MSALRPSSVIQPASGGSSAAASAAIQSAIKSAGLRPGNISKNKSENSKQNETEDTEETAKDTGKKSGEKTSNDSSASLAARVALSNINKATPFAPTGNSSLPFFPGAGLAGGGGIGGGSGGGSGGGGSAKTGGASGRRGGGSGGGCGGGGGSRGRGGDDLDSNPRGGGKDPAGREGGPGPSGRGDGKGDPGFGPGGRNPIQGPGGDNSKPDAPNQPSSVQSLKPEQAESFVKDALSDKHKGVTILTLGADNCGPCKSLQESLQKGLAKDQNAGFNVVKLETKDYAHPDAASQATRKALDAAYGKGPSSGFPTSYVIKDGKVIGRVDGNDPEALKQLVKDPKSQESIRNAVDAAKKAADDKKKAEEDKKKDPPKASEPPKPSTDPKPPAADPKASEPVKPDAPKLDFSPSSPGAGTAEPSKPVAQDPKTEDPVKKTSIGICDGKGCELAHFDIGTHEKLNKTITDFQSAIRSTHSSNPGYFSNHSELKQRDLKTIEDLEAFRSSVRPENKLDLLQKDFKEIANKYQSNHGPDSGIAQAPETPETAKDPLAKATDTNPANTTKEPDPTRDAWNDYAQATKPEEEANKKLEEEQRLAT